MEANPKEGLRTSRFSMINSREYPDPEPSEFNDYKWYAQMMKLAFPRPMRRSHDKKV